MKTPRMILIIISFSIHLCTLGQTHDASNNCSLIEISEFPLNSNISFKNVKNIPFVCLKNRGEVAVYKVSVNSQKPQKIYFNNNFNENIIDFYCFKNQSNKTDIAFLTDKDLFLIRNNKINKYAFPKEFTNVYFDRICVVEDNVVILYNKNPDFGNSKVIGAKFRINKVKLVPMKRYYIKNFSSDLLTVYSNQNSVIINENRFIVAELSNKSLFVNDKYFIKDNENNKLLEEIKVISKLYKLDPTMDRLNQLDKLDARLSRNINVFADQMYIYKVSKGKLDTSGSAFLTLDVYDKLGKTISYDRFAFFFFGEWPNWIYEYRISKNDFPLHNIAYKNYLITNGHVLSILELPAAYNPNGKSIIEINKDIYTSRLENNTKIYLLIKRIPGLIYTNE